MSDPHPSDRLPAGAPSGFLFGLGVARQALGFEMSPDVTEKILRQLKRIAEGEEVVGILTAAELKMRGVGVTADDMIKAVRYERWVARELCLALSDSFKAFDIELPAEE